LVVAAVDKGDLAVGLIVPIVATFLAIMWKGLARDGRASASDEWLVVFELLLAAIGLSISEVFDSDNPQIIGAFVAVLSIFVIATVTAFGLQSAIMDRRRTRGKELDAWVFWLLDGVGIAAFAAVYFALN
jgi:hypothetical protein